MTEETFYWALLYSYIGLAIMTAVSLLFIAAPYGRHSRGGFGPRVPSRIGWLLMEAPASLGPLALFLLSGRRDPVTVAFLLIWQAHYVHRAFIFPFRMRAGAPMPILVALMGLTFNFGNGYLNWRYLTWLAPAYPAEWLSDPRFLLGLVLFAAGMAVNQHSDWILLHLRKPGETGYKIPHGGMYRFVSCPNYLGECVEWLGWALLTWSLPGLVFALWTAANLVPRAIAHHRDYLRRFPDYPTERRAVIPFVL
ncbi:MAG: methyltransferase [Polyangia bacterium]